MKSPLTTSLVLNLILLGGLVILLADRQRAAETIPVPAQTQPLPMAAAPAHPAPQVEPEPFRWSQLEAGKDYWAYVANLRAAGCPEASIQDIVRGDTERAFAFERRQLEIDGSGSGPWSQAAEQEMVASLLGESSTPAQDSTGDTGENNPAGLNDAAAQSRPDQTQATGGFEMACNPPQSAGAWLVYPLFLQSVKWSALGFNADQQAAIAQARQQFMDELNDANQASGQPAQPGNAASPAQRWQAALQKANDTLRGLMSAADFNAYELQQYMNWFQPQVAANMSGGQLFINPDAFGSQ